MNPETLAQAKRRIISELEKAGYRVQLAPPLTDFPFDLDGYVPEMLATRGDEHAIVDVRTDEHRRDHDRYQRLRRTLERHPGWDLMMATVIADRADVSAELSNEQIGRALGRVADLMRTPFYDVAIPILWSLLMGAMRIEARKHALPVDELFDDQLLPDMYSLGWISYDDYDKSMALQKLRNRAIHGVEQHIALDQVDDFRAFLVDKLVEWEFDIDALPTAHTAHETATA